MTTLDQNEPGAARGGSAVYAMIIAFIAAVGGFLFGYDLSLISSAGLYLRTQFNLNDAAFGLVMVSAGYGCVLGPFVGSWLCDRIGRERTMVVASLLLAAGALATAFARAVTLPFPVFGALHVDAMTVLVIFRIIGGVGVGLCSIASPMYLAEVAPSRKRGQMGVMYQLAIVVGSTMAPLASILCIKLFPVEPWRWMFGSQMVVILVFVAFLFVLPRSPRWLAQKGRFDEAYGVLAKVDGPDYAKSELEEIKASLNQESGGLRELFTPGIRYALLIGFALAFFNMWTGWSGVGGYIPRLMEIAGRDNKVFNILYLFVTYAFMAILTVVSLFTVDKLGRRSLWLFASVFMAVAMAGTGLAFHLKVQNPSVLLFVFGMCAVPHGLALGPLPWLMMSEVFPTRVRAKAVALTTTFLWAIACLQGQWIPSLITFSTKTIGSAAGLFWIFTLICIVSTIFGLKMLPETKGRTLEHIAEGWKKRDKKAE
jgi:sugar porter (SP) family MFS transporter